MTSVLGFGGGFQRLWAHKCGGWFRWGAGDGSTMMVAVDVLCLGREAQENKMVEWEDTCV